METEEKMHIAERYIHARPLPASQSPGARSVTGLHRKSLIRLMKGDLHCSQERGALYGPEVFAVIWESVCAERLTPLMAQHLEAYHPPLTNSMVLLK